MTNFLHWRKMSGALVLWSGYVVAWGVITGSGPALFTLWWLAGTIACCSLWVAMQSWPAGIWLRRAHPAGFDEPAPGQPPTIPPAR
jgi:hypothetical protein